MARGSSQPEVWALRAHKQPPSAPLGPYSPPFKAPIGPATLTQPDVSLQGHEHIAGLEVTVDDLLAVQEGESLQHLTAHHLDLGLRQPTVQLYRETDNRGVSPRGPTPCALSLTPASIWLIVNPGHLNSQRSQEVSGRSVGLGE